MLPFVTHVERRRSPRWKFEQKRPLRLVPGVLSDVWPDLSLLAFVVALGVGVFAMGGCDQQVTKSNSASLIQVGGDCVVNEDCVGFHVQDTAVYQRGSLCLIPSGSSVGKCGEVNYVPGPVYYTVDMTPLRFVCATFATYGVCADNTFNPPLVYCADDGTDFDIDEMTGRKVTLFCADGTAVYSVAHNGVK